MSQRTVLLAVCGISPAILTETVWALAEEKPPVIPDEVVVLTTSKGASDISSILLTESAAWGGDSPWAALRRRILGAKAGTDSRLQLAATRVIELPDARRGVKRPAEDLRTPADNSAAADFILEEVRRLTENPGIRVVASIAGGRKTMGALLYAAMSLIGRETDRVTHVLVNEPFDQCREFFFPDQPQREVAIPRENRKLRATDARIELADLPFVPLRNLFERDFARRPGTFAALVAEASKELSASGPRKVRVSMIEPLVKVDGIEVRFTPREHVLLVLLARNCMAGSPPFPDQPKAHEAYAELVKQLLADSEKVNSPSDWRRSVSKTVVADDIRKILSSVRNKLKNAGSEARRLERAIDSRRPSLRLQPDAIEIA